METLNSCPCQGAAGASGHSGLQDRAVRPDTGLGCSPPLSAPLPWQLRKPDSPDKGCKQPSSCLLPPLSCLQGIKRIAHQGHNDPLPSHDCLQSSWNTPSPLSPSPV